MRDELLFIDGELVDLDDNTKITLNIKSNLFSDLSKIVSNNTYTIKLPKTVRNERIIQHADLPACQTDYPRKFHDARYFRKGVEIISNGKAAIVSVSETIDITLIWGNIILLQGIVKNDKTLNELKDTNPVYHLIWEKQISNYQDTSPFIVSEMNMDIRNYDTVNYIHPSVRVNWILDRIAKDNNLNLVFDSTRQSFIDSLIIPLLSKQGNGKEEQNSLLADAQYTNGEKWKYLLYVKLLTNKSNSMLEVVNYNTNNSGVKVLKNNTKIHIRGYFYFDYVSNLVRDPTFVAYKIKDGNVEEVLSANAASLRKKGDSTWTVFFDFKEETSALNKGDIIYFAFDNIGFFTNNGGTDYLNFWLSPYIEEVSVQGDGSDGFFPIILNLPKIKQIDFIKTISALTGTFAVVKGNDTINFVSVDTLIANKNKAKNWTHKVVASFQDNKPNSITHTIDGFAQNNIYAYKDDDTVKREYNDSLIVENETIEIRNDSVTLPFAATDTLVGKAHIPLYSYDSDEKGKAGSVEPRILVEVNNNGKSMASFDALIWESLMSKYYQSYQNIIRKPVIITEKIEISDIELREIDVTVPVYLAQYGRYYAPINIKAEDTGICECKLLQLEV